MGAGVSYSVRSPGWVLTYQSVDITSDISSMVLDIAYTDRLGAASGDLEILLEDSQKLWQGPWYPQEGDVINLTIGYTGEAQLPCGSFQIDELLLNGPPDTFHIRCLATYITPAMRTKRSCGYEGQTLTQIASTIAGKYSLAMISEADELNPVFERITQNQETDLGFLRRIATEHDYDFTIRGSTMVFYARSVLEAAQPVASIARDSVMRFSFKDRSYRIYETAQVAYQQPFAKALISQSANTSVSVPTTDNAKRVSRCENGQQAQLKASSMLHARNMVKRTAGLACSGSPAFAAGNVVTITGFGVSDGNYLIEQARHRLTRAAGYTTEIEARNLAE
ncbi:MAG TPA: contractile injection system protein, VgrG/Pvc8 family [Candidatus Binataceae bacterium]|nr:contractile injection system protein, VgrG/Pvc8 family [Candidatus Binataceae bacterium]